MKPSQMFELKQTKLPLKRTKNGVNENSPPNKVNLVPQIIVSVFGEFMVQTIVSAPPEKLVLDPEPVTEMKTRTSEIEQKNATYSENH